MRPLFARPGTGLPVSSLAVALLFVGSAIGQQQPPTDSSPAALLGELGCAACHVTLAVPTTLRGRAPDLSSAGQRYNPAYLFAYLQKPKAVRRHLGRARMPDFHLSADEALALVLFLAAQKQTTGDWPELPAAIRAAPSKEVRPLTKAAFQKLTSSELQCMVCHSLDATGGAVGVEFGNIGYRLQRDWTRRYLAAPGMFGVPATSMPPQFFELTEDRKGYREIVADAAAKIDRVTGYLFARDHENRRALEASFSAAKAASPKIDATMGERIFRALNCAACHRHPTIRPRAVDAAPDLTRENQRVSTKWLKGFLARPHAIRPFGNRPGDGSRMPDFRLTNAEVTTIASYLGAKTGSQELPAFEPTRLTAFSMRKAKLLFHEKLACLGCHQLGETGGRIGPDLTDVASRLRPAYVYRMITQPRSLVPHTVMPKIPIPDKTARLIANYLLQASSSASAMARQTAYLSLVDTPVLALPGIDPTDGAAAKDLYRVRCAACHGATGRSDGFNARFLPVKPTVHADAAYMSKRPDDTLFDGIYAGGYILNKSHLMPAWGQSLSRRQIRGLVKYMRTLCNCQGPTWSRR